LRIISRICQAGSQVRSLVSRPDSEAMSRS
jgi:hypothetical protein